jgi:SAM-dependent methyltransferase
MVIGTTISTCFERDVEIWKYSAQSICRHIRSGTYVLIVPERDLRTFQQISPVSYKIVSEESVIPGESIDTIRQQLPSELSQRAGWYYQQFLKIEYFRSLPAEHVGLIWDSDTIPVRDLDFFDAKGRFVYRTGTHYPKIHEPYFKLINQLLGIDRTLNESFIAQCFPALAGWVKSFCNEIESKNSGKWWQAVLRYISSNPSYSGFSEYESLGTFISNLHSDKVVLSPGRYYRPYNSFFSLDQLHHSASMNLINAQDFEYVVYDLYEKRRVTGLNIGCGRTRIENSVDSGICINIDKVRTGATDFLGDLDKGLPFEDASFSHVIAHNILEHVEDLLAGCLEIDRLLKAGGILQIEVPHIGSYNHGTDVTHRRGLTFNSFDFLFKERSYLYPEGDGPFRYKLLQFNRENVVDGTLVRESFDAVPERLHSKDWLSRVHSFEIPGTFGFILLKV